MSEDVALDAQNAMRAAMRGLNSKFGKGQRAQRKTREKEMRSVVDGRTLRAKGRTEQLNVKVKPDIKMALAAQVESEGVTIADWIERNLEVLLRMRGA